MPVASRDRENPGALWPVNLAELVSSSFSEAALNNVKIGGGKQLNEYTHARTHRHRHTDTRTHAHTHTCAHADTHTTGWNEGARRKTVTEVAWLCLEGGIWLRL